MDSSQLSRQARYDRPMVYPVWFEYTGVTPATQTIVVYKWDFSATPPAVVTVDLTNLPIGYGLAIKDLFVEQGGAGITTLFHDTDVAGNRVVRGDFAANGGAVPTFRQTRYLPPLKAFKITSAATVYIHGQGYIYNGVD